MTQAAEKKTSVKDTIADALRADGYDFMTAYEEAHRAIEEFKASGEPQVTLVTKFGTKITIKNANHGTSK